MPDESVLHERNYPSGLRAGILPMTFGNFRLCIGRAQFWPMSYDRGY